MALTAPLVLAEPEAEEQAAVCPGYHHMDGVGNVCPQPNGSFEVYSPDGSRSLGYIRHVDPVPTEPEPAFPASGSQVECVPNTSGTYYIHVVYARAHNDADGYATWAPKIRTMIANANQLVDDATVATGGTGAGLKVYCSGGQVVVENEVLPTSAGSASFSSIVDDLIDKGYDDPKTKIWVFYDDTGACSCGGTGHWYDDDSDSVNNVNNGNYPYQPFFAVNFGYDSTRIMLHELGHNVGAVQDSAPRSTLAGHCYDGRDTMCYNDGGPNGHLYSTGYCSVEVWDCGRNDYFHANPAPGSYLDTHWNIGSSYVRYIKFGEVNSAPTMTSLTCSPTNGVLGDTVGCSFSATDTRDDVAYNVNWGDGTTERIPSSGYLASGTSESSSHVYATDGSFIVSVSASDDNATTPLTGAALTRIVNVQAAPTMQLLSCTPDPVEVARTVTCSFRAADNSSGVYYTIDWGDGSPTTRVPPSGTVPPGTARTATHAWSATGTYSVGVYATDNGVPSLSSATMTISHSVSANLAPTMTALDCAPNPVPAQSPTTCTFTATDSVGAVYYTIDWGDGSPTTRVPSTGTVAPGISRSAAHTFGMPGTFSVSVTATDDGSPALTAPAITELVEATLSNVAPVVESISCADGSATAFTSCSVRASDADSTGVKYEIEWGDGTTTTLPASGFVSPGATQPTGHTYAAPGAYTMNVTATDNGIPVATSVKRSITVDISPDITPPSLTVSDPRPGRVYYGCSISEPTLGSLDAIFVMRGCARALASDASGIEKVTVRLNGVLLAEDASAPYTIEFTVPFTQMDADLTVTAIDTYGNERSVTRRVDAL